MSWGDLSMTENYIPASKSTPTEKITEVHIDDRDYTVISVFEGTETASKLLYDMAVSRVLNEPSQISEPR